MDPKRFDRIARLFGSSRSRRDIVKTLAGGTLGAAAAAIGLGSADAAGRPRGMGVSCTKNGDCDSAVCLPKDRTGRRVCGCGSANDCPSAPNECYSAGGCAQGVCITPIFNANAPCAGGSGVCLNGGCALSTTTAAPTTTTVAPPTTTSTTRQPTTTVFPGTTQGPIGTTAAFGTTNVPGTTGQFTTAGVTGATGASASTVSTRFLGAEAGHLDRDLEAFARSAAAISARLRGFGKA